jgi:hypothetical protein
MLGETQGIEMRYTIDNWAVAWNSKRSLPGMAELRASGAKGDGAVEVGEHPDTTGWTDPYDQTITCCEFGRGGLELSSKIAALFIDFHALVVRDGIDPLALHREFLKIEEYRYHIHPDIDRVDYAAEG